GVWRRVCLGFRHVSKDSLPAGAGLQLGLHRAPDPPDADSHLRQTEPWSAGRTASELPSVAASVPPRPDFAGGQVRGWARTNLLGDHPPWRGAGTAGPHTSAALSHARG